jgi:hypothetical protein
VETGDFSEELRSPQFLAFNILQVRLRLKTLCGLAPQKTSLFPTLIKKLRISNFFIFESDSLISIHAKPLASGRGNYGSKKKRAL